MDPVSATLPQNLRRIFVATLSGGSSGGSRNAGGGRRGQTKASGGNRRQGASKSGGNRNGGSKRGGGTRNNNGGNTSKNNKYTNDIANGKIPGQAGKDYPNFSLKQLEKKGFKGIQPAPADKIVANYPKNSGRKSNNNSRKNNGGSNKGRELDGIFRMERLNKLPSLYHHQPYFDRINLDNSLESILISFNYATSLGL